MNELRDYLKRELGVTDEQYELLVIEARKTSPVVDLNNLAMVNAMQMQMIDNLGAMVSMLMNKVNELEAIVNA